VAELFDHAPDLASFVKDAAGKVIGLIGISRDVRAPVDPRHIPVELAAALGCFENNLAEPVTPAILARRARLTPAKFARLIHRFFDLIPSQFLTQIRLAAAARLLRETSLGVSEFAQDCGFYDHSAFSRACQSAMRITPSAYREATQKALLLG
jgi:transcriptional regulator GlxA family with amidase domain